MADKYDVVVIGAGAMGLAAAYEATQAGRKTLVLESDSKPGGMAAHCQLGDLSIERYYHFICKTDFDTFQILSELGIQNSLKWRTTKMGYFFKGKNYPWGNPFALLKFPHLTFFEKCRYAMMALWCTKRKNWDNVEPLTAPEWLKAWLGERSYNLMWDRLFRLKFYDYTDDISATWIGTRIKRVGLSRKSMFEEQMGYLEGGTETLVNALVEAIRKEKGIVRCDNRVVEINENEDKNLSVILEDGTSIIADNVISTVPTPFISQLVPSLPEPLKAQYDAIPNIGVACLIFKLSKKVTPNFWHNIIDDELNVPGIIEFSNLRQMDDHIVYVPYYMPVTEERWSWSDEALLAEALKVIQAVNPNIKEEDVLETRTSRLRYSQPICRPNFLDTLPPTQTPIQGLQIADTCYYYPEDRGISESIKLGRQMARNIKI